MDTTQTPVQKAAQLGYTDPNTLADKLREASAAYYRSGETVMSDDEFDMLKDLLQEWDPQNSFLKEVGAKETVTSGWPKATHIIPMGSLEKCKDIDEMKSWYRSRAATLGQS